MSSKIRATPDPAAQSWKNPAPAKYEAKSAPTTPSPAPAPATAPVPAPQPAPALAALASAAMAALLEVQERLSEDDQGHGRALEPPIEPEPTPAPPPGMAPAQRLQAVLAQLREAPVRRSALAGLQAVPMNLNAYRAPSAAQSDFGINRFI